MSETPLKITPEQQRQFDEDGFFLVEDALPPDRIAALLQRLDEFVRPLPPGARSRSSPSLSNAQYRRRFPL